MDRCTPIMTRVSNGRLCVARRNHRFSGGAMTRKRNLGNLAAIGGLTAAVALLTGLSAARADELADLRANQQLLQLRIDQLAQAQAQGAPGATGGNAPVPAFGTAPVPGQALAGGSFPRSFLIPGTETSIRVGGFVDFTALDFLQGGGALPGSNYSSNAGQNGQAQTMPLTGGLVPGAPGSTATKPGFVAPSVNAAPSRNNGVLEFSPKQSRHQHRDPHPDGMGRGAHVPRIRLGRLQQLQLPDPGPRRRQQPGAAVEICLWHVGRVPRRPGDLELLRRRRRHRIDGIRRHAWGRPAACASRRSATPLPAPMAARSRSRSKTRTRPWSRRAVSSSSDLNLSGTGNATTPAQQRCRHAVQRRRLHGAGGGPGNPAVQKAPNLTAASYWSQPWGHIDFAGVMPLLPVRRRSFHQRAIHRLWRAFRRRRASWLVGLQQGRFPVQLCRRQRASATTRAAAARRCSRWRPTSAWRPRARTRRRPAPGDGGVERAGHAGDGV